jgi:PIN domain nuclease of toxin-antitoxin system
VTTVLDAYALIALRLDEPAAEEVERILRGGDAAVTSVNYGEALDRLVRGRRIPEPRVRAGFEPLLDSSLRRIAVGFPLAESAARLRAKHYHRERQPLSLADYICIAAAGSDGAVATADETMLAVAEAEGVGTVPLDR